MHYLWVMIVHSLPPYLFPPTTTPMKKTSFPSPQKCSTARNEQTKRSIGLPWVPCQRPAPKRRLLRACAPRADIMQRLAPRLNPQRAHPTPTRVSPRRVCSPAAHPERQRRPVEGPNPQQREQADGERGRGRGCGASTSASACRRGSGYHCSHALLRVAAAVDIAI